MPTEKQLNAPEQDLLELAYPRRSKHSQGHVPPAKWNKPRTRKDGKRKSRR